MNCSFCGHPESQHCRGQIQHEHGTNGNGKPPSAIIICAGRHCDNPLCCCVSFNAMPLGEPKWLSLVGGRV